MSKIQNIKIKEYRPEEYLRWYTSDLVKADLKIKIPLINIRFKNIFSPYGDKKIGEFFLPITTRAMTEIGINYKHPFKKWN